MIELKGQVAIVTGAGTGIGRGVALALAGEGARAVLCGRRMDRLQETLAAIRAAGGEGLAVQADVSQEPVTIVLCGHTEIALEGDLASRVLVELVD